MLIISIQANEPNNLCLQVQGIYCFFNGNIILNVYYLYLFTNLFEIYNNNNKS